FTRTVSVLANDLDGLSEAEARTAKANNISFVAISSTALTCNGENGVQVSDVAGKVETFDSVYPVMGCTPLITALDGLDISRDDDGMIVTDKHRRTCVEHIYATGDVVNSLKSDQCRVGGRRHRGDSHSSEPGAQSTVNVGVCSQGPRRHSLD
ncbi:MAG: thioredoxin reductase, partial [Caballeronia sp.]|nr:thioredoxin reductase [Caballeronia sp.]